LRRWSWRMGAAATNEEAQVRVNIGSAPEGSASVLGAAVSPKSSRGG